MISAVSCLSTSVVARRRRTGQRSLVRNASGTIETFLVQGKVDASKLATSCAPLASHFDLECLVFFSLGVPAELVASVAGGALGIHGVCPVYIADCYGVIGWDNAAGMNVELLEKGRGTEYGGVGGKGGEGVVVAAFRGGGHKPTALDAGSLPADCALHMVVTDSGTPAAPPAGVIYGGVAKACYKLEHSGDLLPIPQFAVSTPSATVSSFTGDAGEAVDATLKELPEGAMAPIAGGYFPCFMRGINKYGEDGVEPAAFLARGLNTRLFGMFAHGELGPPVGQPVVCDAGELPAVGVTMHSMTSILALYGS